MKYVVHFDDGTMLGSDVSLYTRPKYVREFPDAWQFTSKLKAETAAKFCNKPSTIEATES